MFDAGSPHDNALDCEPDVSRLFGLADIGTRGMLGGWSDPEEGHAWNDGAEAGYAITMRPPCGRLMLVLVGEPYITRVRPLQELTIFGNGFRVGYWRLTQRTEVTLSAPLEPEWWRMRKQQALMRLAFYLPHSVRPKDIADGPDSRELGFCFRSLCLRRLPD
jgi:hypothetical protein